MVPVWNDVPTDPPTRESILRDWNVSILCYCVVDSSYDILTEVQKMYSTVQVTIRHLMYLHPV